MIRVFSTFLVAASLLALSGCLTTGPLSVRTQTGLYNRSVIKTLNEQLLLNLVRAKYRDIPYFIEVNSITTNKTTEVTGVNLFNGSPPFGILQSDSPTISYAPLQGEDFLKKILSPIPPESLLVLTQSGWSVQRVLGICVERMNHLDNAASASGPTPAYVPRYEEFHRMIELLRTLQKAGLVHAVADPDGNVVLEIREHPQLRSELAEFRSLLGVPAGMSRLAMTNDFLNVRPGQIVLRTRSIASIMFFLSQNVAVPDSHVAKGLVTVTTGPNGDVFDWDRVVGDFIKVHCSPTPPSSAYTAINYRGHWFYIRDDDLNSKSTFMLLTQLFNLQAGQTKVQAPTLTIPVRG